MKEKVLSDKETKVNTRESKVLERENKANKTNAKIGENNTRQKAREEAMKKKEKHVEESSRCKHEEQTELELIVKEREMGAFKKKLRGSGKKESLWEEGLSHWQRVKHKLKGNCSAQERTTFR